MMTRKTKAVRKSRARLVRARPALVHQFLVVLQETDPLVWRRIQVPDAYSFWDLHVAIQDAMGWQDYHLHEFVVSHPKHGVVVRLGIPDEDVPDDRPSVPGWQAKIEDYFSEGSPPARYLYDFGDEWQHAVIYEGVAASEVGERYPRCVAGAGSCPPEDVGGIHGYAEFLRAMANPRHPEHSEYAQWAVGRFNPAPFDPMSVVFSEPTERFKLAFGS